MKKVTFITILSALLVMIVSVAYYTIITGSSIMIQSLINGVFAGSIYGLLAVGLSLIFGVMKVINICHGEFVVLGGYVCFWLYTLLGFNPFISMLLAFLLLFIAGLLIGKGLINRALRFSLDAPIIITFGLSLCLQNLMRIFWTATPRAVTTSYGVLKFCGVTVPNLYLIIFAITAFILFLLQWFLTKTYTGMAIRAVAMDARIASLFGVNPTRVNTLSYALGSALAAATGALIALIFPFDPSTGSMYTMRAFAVVVLGGVGYVPGAFIGGIILGVAESVASFFLGDAVRNGIAFFLFLLILILKPTGLLRARSTIHSR